MRRLVACLLTGLLLTGCTGVFFQPMQPWLRTPATVGLAYEDLRLPTPDGPTISAWFLPARQQAKGTILFLHGNAQNISTHLGSVYWMPERGYNVLLLDYRGYGASEGLPTLAGVQQDIDTAMRHLVGRPDIDPRRIVLLGQSLGGALGLHYLAHNRYRDHLRGAVIDSAFTGYQDIAREKLRSSWLTWPLSLTLPLTVSDAYRPLHAAPGVAPIPLLIMHGDRDEVIPLHHAQQLFDAAREPKSLWIIQGARHIQSLDDTRVRGRLVDWLDARFSD